MNRSGYVDGCDLDPLDLGRWRGQVKSAIRGKRGQRFFRELAAAMDAMPDKVLIADELVDDDGCCCAVGAVLLARGMDPKDIQAVDPEDPYSVSRAADIAHQLAAEIEYENDECGERWERDDKGEWRRRHETPAERWVRMRKWVEKRIITRSQA